MSHNTHKKIKGVNATFYSDDKKLIASCQAIEKALLQERIVASDAVHTPWLISPEVFTLDREIKHKLEAIGQALLLYFDAIQALYPTNKTVQTALDYGVKEDLKGLDLAKRIHTFRLDVILENNEPKVAEVEEPYAGIGLMHAFSKAYPINCDYYYQRIASSGLTYIFVDDQWGGYWGELQAVQRRLKEQTGLDTELLYLSALTSDHEGTALRYEYTRDIGQYPASHRAKIIHPKLDYINPLFHGYASKAIFALFFDPELVDEWKKRLGSLPYQVLAKAFPKSEILASPSPDQMQALAENRRKKCIKVVYCPDDLEFNWGSRGVYFGDTNKKTWLEILSYVEKGQIPFNPHIKHVVYMQSELVESDRYDLPFWDRENKQMSLMTRARIRLQPIFYRKEDKMELVSSMATFVNTSRKVHTGKHAIHVPVVYT